MKTFNEFITEASGDKAAYQKFFNSMLKKFGVKSASELDDKKKKEFYDAIDAGWEADNESITEKSKYTITTNPKKLSDDDLMDFYDWLENTKPSPFSKMNSSPFSRYQNILNQREKALAACKKELKKRGFKSIIEKSKYTTTTNPKKLSDDDLMDFYYWLENMKDPNPDNEDQRKKALAACKKEMKKRRFMNYT